MGTGTLSGTNIRRVFVNPHHQQKGTGKLIVRELEKKALIAKITTLDLEASLVSRQFWESTGFVVQREDFVPVRNDQRLHFYRMTKTLDAR
jgi:GNAT superfamily N-acetyltransferase